MIALCLDAGSSSLKYAFYESAGSEGSGSRIASGELSGPIADPALVLDQVWTKVKRLPDVVGHRIVFGGSRYVEPVLTDDGILRDLEALVGIEPLHLRAELDLIYAVARRSPAIPQVLCFDTAFHQSMPAIAKALPLPPDVDPVLRRYGFHGLSYEYVMGALGAEVRGRTVVAHLGSGASLCALRDGHPVDTTMGFSALGGLMMATRPGDLDPGVILALAKSGYGDREKLTDLLYRRCGLAGVSGRSGDVRDLVAAPNDPLARAALDLFNYQLLKQTGAMIAVLGGIDTLVFTGGIGEHEPSIRASLCTALHHAGVRIDPSANARNAPAISAPDSTVAVRVIPTDENIVIARHAFDLMRARTIAP